MHLGDAVGLDVQVKQIADQRAADLKRKEPEAMPKPILGPAPTGAPSGPTPSQAPPTLPPPPPRPVPTPLPPPPQVGASHVHRDEGLLIHKVRIAFGISLRHVCSSGTLATQARDGELW